MTEFDNTNHPMKNSDSVQRSPAGSIIAAKVAEQPGENNGGMPLAGGWLEYTQTPSIGRSKPRVLKWKLAASLACLALLFFVSSASAVLTVTPDEQYGQAGTWPFTPTWTPASGGLIAGLAPTTATGNFSLEIPGRNVNSLTAGGSLTIDKIAGTSGNTTSTNYVTCGNGSGAGSLVIYTLPANANGYNITNITVFGGWADNGRDDQAYTVWYSTVSDPANFIELTTVQYIPPGPGNTPTSTKVIINDSANGVIAANVAQLMFDFTSPAPGSQYNGYVGYAAITVGGNAAPTPPTFTITTQTQQGSGTPFTPSYTLETPSLIAGLVPSTATGNFGYENTNCNVDSLTEGGSLTIDSVTGNAGDSVGQPTTSTNYVTCGGADSTGSTIIYTLPSAGYGIDVTNIVVYNGWKDGGRMGQYYILSYSTVSAPTTFVPLTTIHYLPSVPNQPTANRVALSASGNSPIAGGISAVKFDFASPYNAANFNNGFQGYAQIIVQGKNTASPPPPPSPILTQDILPSYAATVVGDQITFTAAYSNSPPVTPRWLFLSGPVTNIISTGVVNVTNNGVVTSTVTVNNLQLTNSGYYTLEGLNATNGAAAPSFSSSAQLVVNSTPAAVGNIILYYAEQAGEGAISPVNGSTNFVPTWTVNTANDLILGSTIGSGPGTFVQGSGNFNLPSPSAPCNPDPTILSDGYGGYATDWPNVGGNTNECSCGTGGAGDTMTYTLPAASVGFDVTNITVYGGWGDHGRNEQKYQILYSTVANPTAFISLGTFDYNPNDPANQPSATRTMLIPVSGALAKNVYAVEIDWNVSSAPKNGWEGYSEVVVQGTPSLVNPVLVQDILPAYAETVVGDQVIFTAAFSEAPQANLQWQFIDTNSVVHNIPGATTATLALNNLQWTNTGSYRLVAVNQTNSLAVVYSTAAPLVVSPVPAPVNNIVIAAAGQTGWGPGATGISTDFSPTWTVNTDNDLIYDSVYTGTYPSSPNTVYAILGNFALAGCNGDPQLLSDGFNPQWELIYNPGTGGNSTLDSCGPYSTAPNASYGGVYLIYTLPASATNGWSLTNITVYGGWGDDTQNEQKYQVLYSTVSAPTNFIAMTGWVDYVPTDPNGWQSATRTTLTPAAGVMAQNVYAVQISFNNQGAPPKNFYSGYSQIIVAGLASPPVPVLTTNITPVTAEDVVGSELTLVAGFSGATSYQWQKNGTNVSGATSPTLTITHLQPADAATNGGYRLVAFNASGSNMTASCNVFVDPAPTPVGNVVTAVAYQTSAAGGFTPTWDTSALSSSLIYLQNPPGGGDAGDFTGAGDGAAGLPVLTDGNYGAFASDGTHPAFAAGGPNAGQYVLYTLGADPNGYDVTNIQIAGGWNDNGRDSQYYTVSYSTVANPTTFIPVVAVHNNLSQNNLLGGGNGRAVASGSGDEATVRTTITPAAGLLAGNVYAIYVDFTTPGGVPNAYSGYSEISVFGSPSAADTLPIAVTAMNENTSTPDWVVETPNLIAGQLPSSVGPGSFAGNFNGEAPTEGLPALTDGTLGPFNMGTTNFATCGGAYGAGSSITYASADGWNLTNIVVYSGWVNYDRDGQFYNITYSTLSAPTTFVPLVSVTYNPPAGIGPTFNRVDIAPANGAVTLATDVYAVEFDFTPQTGGLDNGYSGYAEIVLQGSSLAPPTPPTIHGPRVAGGNLILTGAGGTPNRGYTWLTTTNLLTPLTNWTVSTTGELDGSGAFSNAIPINLANPHSFFRLRMP